MASVENFKYLFAGKLKGMAITPKGSELSQDGKAITHYEISCPVKKEFVCSFDVVSEAPKKRGRPKKSAETQ